MAKIELTVELEITKRGPASKKYPVSKPERHVLIAGALPVPVKLVRSDQEREVQLVQDTGTFVVDSGPEYALLWTVYDNPGTEYAITVSPASGRLVMTGTTVGSGKKVTDKVSTQSRLAVDRRMFSVSEP